MITPKEKKEMTHMIRTFVRISLWMLPIWAALLFWATFTEQPDPLTAFADFAAYVTTSQFLLSHILGSIVGAAIGSIGVIGLMLYLQDTKTAGRAIIGMVASVVGNILMSSTYGVAAFAEPAMGRLFQAGQQNTAEFYNQVYTAPLVFTALSGLLLFLLGGVFTGLAIAGSGRLPRWSGWMYAVLSIGFALGLFFPPIIQNVTSGLLFLTTLAIAWNASRQGAGQNIRMEMATGI
jgi:hypothetical protein